MIKVTKNEEEEEEMPDETKHVAELVEEEQMDIIEEEDLPQAPRHLCYICNKEFCSISSQRMHIRNVHHLDTTDLSSNPQSACSLCNEFKFSKVKDLHKHLETAHNIEITSRVLTFSTVEEFDKWKEEIETTTNSSYIKPRGDYKQKDGSKKLVYSCCRSGTYRPHGTGQRALKSQGTRKLNSTCPARMEVVIGKEPGSKCVKVSFTETHCGHSLNDLGHITLTKTERVSIANDLMAGVEYDKILDKIRENVSVPLKRKHLVTRKDLRNIKKTFKINDVARSTSDMNSIEIWVNEMKQLQSKNPVLFFKQQEIPSNVEGLEADDLCLVVMTEGQMRMLLQYGSDCVCLDSTCGLETHDFELTTLLVAGNNREGFPAAFLFSSKQNEEVYKIFFDVIKAHVGIIKPHTFMSDDTDEFYNAWAATMGDVTTRLLSPWHVVRAWQKKLVLIKSPEKQRNVFKQLKTAQMETNEESFSHLMESLVKLLKSDSSTECFGDYLVLNYCNRVNLWAYSYRKGLGINSNVGLEKIHRIFKYNYREGKKEKKMDKPINAVVKFVRDKEFDRVISTHKGKSGQKANATKNRHRESLTTDDIVSSSEIDGKVIWYIQSASCTELHEVRINKNCNCSLKCEYCNKCLHNFSCTCSDYLIKGNMCKHMHQVCAYQNRNTVTIPETCIAAENIPGHLSLQIIQTNENAEMELAHFTTLTTEPDFASEEEKNKRLESIRAEFDKVMQMCYTLEHVKILEEAVKSVEPKFLAMSLVNHNALLEGYLHNC